MSGAYPIFFAPLMSGYFLKPSASQMKRDPPCSLTHRVVFNPGEDVSWARSSVEEANLWETMRPVSASSKTPLCQTTFARKLIYKVAAWFFLFRLYIPRSTFPYSARSLLRFWGGWNGSWFSKKGGLVNCIHTFSLTHFFEWLTHVMNWRGCVSFLTQRFRRRGIEWWLVLI